MFPIFQATIKLKIVNLKSIIKKTNYLIDEQE